MVPHHFHGAIFARNRESLGAPAMQFRRKFTLPGLLALLAGALIVRVVIVVVLSYRHYFPPDFQTDFLLGRESYFFGVYRWAFYVHILAGPSSLVLGLILLSDNFRVRFPRWHRRLGRMQVANVLLLVAPSGLWMALHVESSTLTAIIAGWGFGTLAVVTGASIALGWRAAVKQRFAEHRRWMVRCYLLLCSAVVLRLIGGAATLLHVSSEWVYSSAAWLSWLVPWLPNELSRRLRR